MDIPKRPNIKNIKITSETQKLISNLGKHDTFPEDDIIKCSKYLVNYINGDRGSIKTTEAIQKK